MIQCEECDFHEWVGERLKCIKGNKTRFYMPHKYRFDMPWGYKRTSCEFYSDSKSNKEQEAEACQKTENQHQSEKYERPSEKQKKNGKLFLVK